MAASHADLKCCKCNTFPPAAPSTFCQFCKCRTCANKAAVRHWCVFCTALKLDQYTRLKYLYADMQQRLDDAEVCTIMARKQVADAQVQTDPVAAPPTATSPLLRSPATTPRKLIFNGNSKKCPCGAAKALDYTFCVQCADKWKVVERRHHKTRSS